MPVERGYPYLRAAGAELQRQSVNFRDLSRIFEKDGRTLYYDDCCHLNDDGVRAVADEMWRLARQSLEAGAHR